jgi:serine/threonine-protein kinase PknG
VDHDCLWRFLRRACAPDPADRFTDADEMAESLHGVLSQVAAASDGQPRPYTSTRWSPPRPQLDGLDWRSLPNPMLPNHPRVPNRIAGIVDGDPRAAVQLAGGGGEFSWADLAAVARAYCEVEDFHHAYLTVEAMVAGDVEMAGMRTVIDTAQNYMHGVVATAAGDAGRAVAYFDQAYADAPGEMGCALAYAAAVERLGDRSRYEEAAALYQQVVVTDPTWVSAVAGLSRVLVALDRPVDAARVLTAVPPAHQSRAEALTLACGAMQRGPFDERVAAAATERLRAVQGDRSPAEAELAVALYGAALTAVLRRQQVPATVGDRSTAPSELARAAEDALLDLADATPNVARRHQLLDQAARTRPWSLW